MVTSKKIKNSDRVFDTITYIICSIIILIVLYPMYFIIIASFSNPADVAAGKVIFFPTAIDFSGYEEVLKNAELWLGYRNTILYAVVGTIFNLIVNLFAAYPLSRQDLVGKKVITIFFIIPMFFTGGLIPTFINISNYGLNDTFWVMVLPFSVVTYFIIVARTFFKNSLPDGLWEAAQIDGCGNLRFFFSMVLPLSKAVIAVIALWSAVGHWNAYFNALIYLRSDNLQPLQIFLRNLLINNQTLAGMATGSAMVEAQQLAELIKYVVIVVSSLPIMCMYPFVQKHFNQGVMVGSLKG